MLEAKTNLKCLYQVYQDGTTERRNDGTTERRNDGTTERRNDGTTRQDCLVAKILFELSSLFCLRYFKKMYNIAVVDKQLI